MLKRLRAASPPVIRRALAAIRIVYRLGAAHRCAGARQATGRPRRERLPWDPPLVRWLNRSLGYLPGASVGTGASGRAAPPPLPRVGPDPGAPRHSAGCARGHGADPCLEGPGSSRPDPNSNHRASPPSTTAPLCCGNRVGSEGVLDRAVQLVLADFVRAQPLDLPEQGVARLAFLRRRRRDVRHEHPGAHPLHGPRVHVYASDRFSRNSSKKRPPSPLAMVASSCTAYRASSCATAPGRRWPARFAPSHEPRRRRGLARASRGRQADDGHRRDAGEGIAERLGERASSTSPTAAATAIVADRPLVPVTRGRSSAPQGPSVP